jgi:hypothetical protein
MIGVMGNAASTPIPISLPFAVLFQTVLTVFAYLLLMIIIKKLKSPPQIIK